MAKEEVLIDIQIDEGESVESINSLRAAVKEMTKARNDANLQTAEGRAQVQALNQAIDANNKKIKENIDSLTKQKLNIGNYKNEIVDAAKEINVFGVSVGDAGQKIASFANPVTAAVGVLTALGAAYAKSTAGAKDLAYANDILSSSISYATNSMFEFNEEAKNGEGIVSKFTTSFITFFAGRNAAILAQVSAMAKQTLRELGIVEIESQRKAKDLLGLAEQQRRIRDDNTKSYEERKDAAQKALDFINQREGVLVDMQQKKLAQFQTLASLDRGNLELQKEIKQIEFEIADIREDSEGKRTEVLNGVNTLLKDQDQLLIANARGERERNQAISEFRLLILRQEVEEKKRILTELNEWMIANDEATALRRNQADFQQASIEGQELVSQYEREDIIETDADNKRNIAALERVKKRNEEEIALRKFTEDVKLGILSKSFAQFSNILGKQTQEGKALATIQALVDTYAGANAQLKLPFPYNLFAAGTTIATGLFNVKEINGFADGGIVRSGFGLPITRSNGDNVLATVKTGEVILNQRQQSALGGASTFRSIGVPGFAEGGVVGFPSSVVDNSTSSPFDLTRLEQTIASLKVRVAVEDINDGQKNYAEITERAQF